MSAFAASPADVELEVYDEATSAARDSDALLSGRLDIRELVALPHSERHLVTQPTLVAEAAEPSSVSRERAPKKRKSLVARTSHRRALPKDAFGSTILPVVIGNLNVVALGTIMHQRPKYWYVWLLW